MKKTVSVLTVAIICTAVSYKSLAQKSFAGTITFETKYEGDINPQKHVPHDVTYTIFENKKKISQSGDGLSRIIIQDGDALTVTMLFDISGYGRIGKLTGKEAILENLTKVKFSYAERSDTKTICGYECKGYDVTVKYKDEDAEDDEEEEWKEIKYIVYTTKEIGKDDNINAFDNPGLSGYPLYTETESKGVKSITQASEVKKTKVKAIDFLVPSDYRISTTDKEWEEEAQKVNEWIENQKK